MAIIPVLATDVELGGTDYSAQISESSLVVDVETHDTTTFTTNGWKTFIGGLKGATLNLTFKRDTDLSGLNAFLWTNLGLAVTFTLQVDGDSAIGATNPQFQGSVVITNETVGATVGQLMGASYSFPISSAITRDVTP